jgi:hypothetical protein
MKRIAIGVALVIAVLLVGWYEGFYRSESAHISNLRAEAQIAQGTVLTLQTEYSALVHSEKQLPAERVALAKLLRLLPDNPQLDSLEKVLFAAAASAGAKIQSITSPPPSNFGLTTPGSSATQGPNQLVLTLGVSGTGAQIQRLYGVLDTDSRLFVIDNSALGISSMGIKGLKPTTAQTAATVNIRAFFASSNPTTAASAS